MATKRTKAPLVVDTLKRDGATRKNIPGMQSHRIEQSKDKNFWSTRVNRA